MFDWIQTWNTIVPLAASFLLHDRLIIQLATVLLCFNRTLVFCTISNWEIIEITIALYFMKQVKIESQLRTCRFYFTVYSTNLSYFINNKAIVFYFMIYLTNPYRLAHIDDNICTSCTYLFICLCLQWNRYRTCLNDDSLKCKMGLVKMRQVIGYDALFAIFFPLFCAWNFLLPFCYWFYVSTADPSFSEPY